MNIILYSLIHKLAVLAEGRKASFKTIARFEIIIFKFTEDM